MTELQTSQRDIPANALQFDSPGRLAFADADEMGRVPITLEARTPEPIHHWWWGRVVHDMEGMFLRKESAIIDYCHMATWDANEILGAATEFEADVETGLTIKGEIFSTREDDRASEVISKGRGGVPFEASIDFNGPGIVAEEVGEGAEVEVNGYTFEGPGVVIRKWPLRSVAVCPYGADAGTRSAFSKSRDGEPESVAVQFLENSMSKPTAKPADAKPDTEAGAENQQTPSETPVEKPAEKPEANEQSGGFKPAEKPADDATRTKFAAELKRFTETFGAENGAKWFQDGKSFEAALEEHAKVLTGQLAAKDAELKASQEKLASLDRGEEEAVEFQDAKGSQLSADDRKLHTNLGEKLGAFAAGLKMPQRKAES